MSNEKNNRLCCVFNTAPHYRSTIFNLIDKELNADFYIGDRGFFKLKTMDYKGLSGFKGELKSKNLWKTYYFQKGALNLAFKSYSKYLFTGELNCISTWFFLILAFFLRKKVYLWSHGFYGNEGFFKRLFKKVYFGLTAGVFLYGEYARNIMIKQGYDPNKLHLIYNSLNYDDQLEIRKKLEGKYVFKNLFPKQNPTAVFIGRMQKRKRIDLIINVIANLKKKGTAVNLLLIGDKDDSLGLDKLSKELNVGDNVCFYGACYDEEVSGSLIYNSDVCVSPGNVGLTAMHVLMYGTPILTSDNFFLQRPEFEAIKQGVTGDFFKDNSIKDLEDKLPKWIGLSKQKREEVRQKAYEEIDKKYNPHRQVETLKEVLNI
ncbi:glycosyltransferase family 4 protein [Labilibacter sediminis]|nr:glycosyltransferase family 4 protein [Labilibacter sediminis]